MIKLVFFLNGLFYVSYMHLTIETVSLYRPNFHLTISLENIYNSNNQETFP